jgi:Sugar-binding cellulase-like
MLFQRQQQKLANFASWAGRYGMPLTTSESWSTWYYIDHPDLDWEWLLEWAEMTVDGAIAHGMWGWTPHNYVQPQFENWKDAGWHRRLTSRFLNGG